MKKRSLYMIELGTEPVNPGLRRNENFIENFQTAILLALLEKGQLARWQFDCCIDELRKQRKFEKMSGREANDRA